MLQVGWGMKEHCRTLVRKWGRGTVILSPRDLEPERLAPFASRISDAGGRTLFDPQIYVPHSDHERLTGHAFWPRTADYWTDPSELSRVVAELLRVNQSCQTMQIICPAPIASVVSDDTLKAVAAGISELRQQGIPSSRILATVALTSDALRNEDRAEVLSEAIEGWDVDGIYLVAEHPNREYLVSDPMWVARILDIVAGARLAQKTVLVGYCSHQMLIAAAAGANAIASGTWLNVRAFSTTKFDEPDEAAVSRRATWYYAPHLLSEFKLAFLDIARRLGVLPSLQYQSGIDGSYAAPLFGQTQPTLAGFGEAEAFRHYLHCLWQQVGIARRPTFKETVAAHEAAIANADTGLAALRKTGIVAQERGFPNAAAANRAALSVLKAIRGPILELEWPAL